MKKCLKITFSGLIPNNFLKKSIQQRAQALEVEGSVQQSIENKEIRIIACGTPEAIEEFLDIIHTETASIGIETIDVEPFIKDKEYRGVFRIIE
jgi:acylphosphatase